MATSFCGGAGHMMGGGYGFGLWFQLLIVLLFFIIVWWMVKGGRPTPYNVSSKETAEGLLKKRYASGEITKKQYEEIKKEIGA